MFQVHQYVYTRLPKELSPRNQEGFQSAYLPDGFLPNDSAIELESRIHFPAKKNFSQKRVIFWQQISGQHFLVIFFISALPEEKDAYGRGGVFLCHGFFVPENLWLPYHTPIAVADFLEAHRLTSLNALSNSPYADQETGKIAPLEIDPAHLPPPSQAIGALHPCTAQVLQALPLLKPNGLSLVLNGTPTEVERVMDQALALAPFQLKVQLGCDPAFDGGRLHFSQMQLFGYEEQSPTTGNPLEINLATGEWTPGDAPPVYLHYPAPHEVWMQHQLSPATTWEEWHRVTKLGTALQEGPMAVSEHWYPVSDLLIKTFLQHPQALSADMPQDWPELLKAAENKGQFSQKEQQRLAKHLPFLKDETPHPSTTPSSPSAPAPTPDSFLSKLWQKIRGK